MTDCRARRVVGIWIFKTKGCTEPIVGIKVTIMSPTVDVDLSQVGRSMLRASKKKNGIVYWAHVRGITGGKQTDWASCRVMRDAWLQMFETTELTIGTLFGLG